MNLKKISIRLSIDEIKKILRIVLDEDPEDELKFIKNNLFKQVQTALQPDE